MIIKHSDLINIVSRLFYINIDNYLNPGFMTKNQWQAYCKGGLSFKEYFPIAMAHIGWKYTYNNLNVIVKSLNKEDAFDVAMDTFHDHFGYLNVIEDDVLFNPLFE